MYRNLFVAWYCLGVMILCLATYLILLPFIGPFRACGALGFSGLFGFIPFFQIFFRNEKEDERDISFRLRAVGAGLASGWATIYFMTGLVHFIFWVYLGSESIPIDYLWLPGICGAGVFFLIAPIRLILLYHKGEQSKIVLH
jgi:hypothetical protein